jgi:hypothetical protein
LGKPIPESALNPPPIQAQPSSYVNNNNSNSNALGDIQPGQVAAVPVSQANNISGVGLVGGGGSSMTEAQDNADNCSEDGGDDQNNEPVGREYLETRVNGKIVSFYCKLCDCSFNDPNAQEMHTKGKRHRLAYKVKLFEYVYNFLNQF